MSMMTKLAAGTAVVAAAGLMPAFADGMEKKKAHYAAPAHHECAASKFAGFYAGIHGGAGSLTSTTTDRDGAIWTGTDQVTEDGLVFGAQVGHNWVKCNSFFGIEADFSWANIDSNRDYFGIFGGANIPQVSHSMDWLASLRTRSGIALGDVLLYVTGGLAFANIETTVSQTNFFGANNHLTVRSDDTRIGWVAGFGSEYAWSDRVRITGDVLYYDLGTESNTASNIANTASRRFDDHHSLWVSRIGINFKLGDREAHYEPLK